MNDWKQTSMNEQTNEWFLKSNINTENKQINDLLKTNMNAENKQIDDCYNIHQCLHKKMNDC